MITISKTAKAIQRFFIPVAKGDRQRRLHKALLRYHDPGNWPLIRQALKEMGKSYLIGDKPSCLIPADDIDKRTPATRRKSGRHGSNRFATKHSPSQPGFKPLSGGKQRKGDQQAKARQKQRVR